MRLTDYIKRRNGVPMGASHSLRNMFIRSLGAGNFATFWIFWNPIWSYYMGKHIFKPLKNIFPPMLSLLATFIFCGLLHDVVIMILRWDFVLLFTPWFSIMGVWVVISQYIKLAYSKAIWIMRAVINLFIIGSSLMLAYQIRI